MTRTFIILANIISVCTMLSKVGQPPTTIGERLFRVVIIAIYFVTLMALICDQGD